MLPCCYAIWPWMLRHNTTSSSDTQTGGVVDTLESRVSIQKDLKELEEQASRNLMRFNKCKCIGVRSTPCTMSGRGLSKQPRSWSLGPAEQLLSTWRDSREGSL